jgi:anti-sigma B factor antagonist
MHPVVTVHQSGSFLVVTAAGEIDMETAPDLEKALIDAASKGGQRVIVDLSAVRFIDSSGLGALVGGHTRLVQSGGDLQIVVTRPLTLRLFEVTALDQVLTLRTSQAEAHRH